MEQMQPKFKVICKGCGAAVSTEVCPYCGRTTDVSTTDAYLDYPEYKCKSAKLTFLNVGFSAIFAVAFGFFGVLLPILFDGVPGKNVPMIVICMPIVLTSIIAFALCFKFLYRYIMTSKAGKEIQGIVYGYANSNYTVNNQNTKTVKILIQTDSGPRYIFYDTQDFKKSYSVNGKVRLKVWKHCFLIIEDDNARPI
ncbi:MAG: hypothetical protein K2K96_13105 [Lachnospiraceae bacterium]|nr:hypothetical protein [Lachnospiraceae bacterium]